MGGGSLIVYIVAWILIPRRKYTNEIEGLTNENNHKISYQEQPEKVKHLTRSPTNRVFFGICGGVGEYLDIDPVIIRVIFLSLIIFAGSGLLLYFIAYFIIPLKKS
ncbi:MAG: PspC domain-containing protein [Oligoflexia bacterium]|nr:PspC domain-containing protein [Oligoflexia bacterium]